MAIVGFEHAINVKNLYKRAVMALGSGGEIVHCEIIFNNQGFVIGSSWNPTGTQFRALEPNRHHENWLYYNLGNQFDAEMFQYIAERVDKGYTLMGLVTNMIMNLDLTYEKQNFCSQLCYETLKNAGHYPLPNLISSSISPNDLHRMVLDLNLNQVFL